MCRHRKKIMASLTFDAPHFPPPNETFLKEKVTKMFTNSVVLRPQMKLLTLSYISTINTLSTFLILLVSTGDDIVPFCQMYFCRKS